MRSALLLLATLTLAYNPLGASRSAAAAETPPPAATFFARPQVMRAQLSPSGTRLAFTTNNAQQRVSIVIVDLSDHDKLATAGLEDADVIRFDWAGDDRLVFSARDLKAAGRDAQTSAPGLFSVRYDGTKFRGLVNTQWVFVKSGYDSDDRALTWNHKLLAVPQPQTGIDPEEVVVGKLNFTSDSLDSITPLWLNVRNGISRDMETDHPPEHVQEWWFDSAGRPRAVYTEHDGIGAYYWHGPDDHEWRLLTQNKALHMPFSIVDVDDKGALFVSVARGPGGTDALTRFDFAINAPAAQDLMQIPGFDFEGHLLKGEAGQDLLGVRLEADAQTTVWFSPTMRAFQAEMDSKLPGHVNNIQCIRCAAADMVAEVFSYSDRDPGMLYVYEAAHKQWRHIMTTMKGIDPRHMASVDFERVKARDGRDLPVWLTLPQDVKPGQPAPTIVMVHGGPWERIGYWRWNAMNQFLASRGYLVIEPEFRGSTGYGDDHYRAGFKQYGQAMEDDLADALHWAEDKGLAVKGKACIMGASYGGYAALMGPVRYPKDFRCVVAWSALTDLDLYLDGNWWVRDDISDEGRKYGLPEAVGDRKTDAAMLRANSPVLLAAQMKSPVLLVHGEEDRRTPFAHFKRMRDVLQAAGNPAETHTYPDEGHGWADTANQIDFAERVDAFLAKNLK